MPGRGGAGEPRGRDGEAPLKQIELKQQKRADQSPLASAPEHDKPWAGSRKAAREITQGTIDTLAKGVKLAKEHFAGVEPADVHNYIIIRLDEMLANTGLDNYVARLQILKEMRMTNEQNIAREVGLARANGPAKGGGRVAQLLRDIHGQGDGDDDDDDGGEDGEDLDSIDVGSGIGPYQAGAPATA